MWPRIRTLAAIFLLSFLVVCAALNFCFSMIGKTPDMGDLSEKMTAYRKDIGEYNVIFIGTSMTAYSIDTDLINDTARQEGCGVRVYNFGVSMLEWPELVFIVDNILKIRPESLKLIVFENPLFDRDFLRNRRTDRKRYFIAPKFFAHHWENIRTLISDPEAQGKALAELVYNTAYHFLNPGSFSRILFPAPGQKSFRSSSGSERFRETAGYVSIEEAASFSADHKKFLEQREEFEKNFTLWIKKSPDAHAEPIVNQRVALLSGLIDKIDRAGYKAGVYLPPIATISAISYHKALEDGFRRLLPRLPVFQYGDPVRYPSLWKTELWYDYGHLSSSGAVLLSRDLRKSLCRLPF